MKMPRDMKWGNRKAPEIPHVVGKACRHRAGADKLPGPTERLQPLKKGRGEVNDMPDKKHFSPQHHRTFLSGNREPVPCYLVCF